MKSSALYRYGHDEQDFDTTDLVMKVSAGLFVLIWSTGFIVAKAIAPVADPNLFLSARSLW